MNGFVYRVPPQPADPGRSAVRAAHRLDERTAVAALAGGIGLDAAANERIAARVQRVVESAGTHRGGFGGFDAFVAEFGLDSKEGVALLCLAEALLRVPDAPTALRLVEERLASADWHRHLGDSTDWRANAATFGLMLTGRLVAWDKDLHPANVLDRFVARAGDAVALAAVRRAVHLIARQFVFAADMNSALAAARAHPGRYSFDMLGEAALTRADARRFFDAYSDAVQRLATQPHAGGTHAADGISVKLSALHPRLVWAQRERVIDELVPALADLVAAARANGVSVTLDAEEADRLELMLDVFVAVRARIAPWHGFGLAVQAYQKRARALIDWAAVTARDDGVSIPVRLVRGAYWDTEIKRAQQLGLPAYPVFTRKCHTDVSYLACARRLLDVRDVVYPQFATHNAHSLAAILEMAGETGGFEFQRLHGMGEAVYDALHEAEGVQSPCRIYAPVGDHRTLVPYLVRRLLENGANTGFLHRLRDSREAAALAGDPERKARVTGFSPHPRIPLPRDLHGQERRNSAGLDLADPDTLAALKLAMDGAIRPWRAHPLVAGKSMGGTVRVILDPADRRCQLGEVAEADTDCARAALDCAWRARDRWAATDVEARANCLERAADLMESRHAELMARIVREGGRTLPDALGEVREAVDACRYYAAEARRRMAGGRTLRAVTGEANELSLHARGVFLCVSPWNFPLAIFVGQIAAALAAGNTVIAKPARQTPLTAYRAVELFLEAGVPAEALSFVPGGGAELGATLLADARLGGVAFTGSHETARTIHRILASRDGALLPFIAETGGINAMIADSTALPEQFVPDVLASAFNSAGQRCSALRVLFIQEEAAAPMMAMIEGAIAELRVGDPGLLCTDVGPVIDETARAALDAHAKRLDAAGRPIGRAALGRGTEYGSFVAPRAVEMPGLFVPDREVFGPILPVVRYRAADLDAVVDTLNATGYGLTLGVHSRLQATVSRIRARARVGNLYVNRNMIGAVIGQQPFGGEGLSGTGPKAGGPHYLTRFTLERTAAINTAAVGGDTDLLSLD